METCKIESSVGGCITVECGSQAYCFDGGDGANDEVTDAHGRLHTDHDSCLRLLRDGVEGENWSDADDWMIAHIDGYDSTMWYQIEACKP